MEEAIDSVINQSIGFENIQLILVDDGSTDNSYSIMKKYEERYSNILCIHLPEKSGAAGRPRNKGLKYVEAPYIMFLDPDDMYDKSALEKMYNIVTSENVDIVTANYKYANEDGTLWQKSVFDEERFPNFKFSEKDITDTFFVWNSGSCNKIFSTELVKKNNILFLEGVPAEDAYFTYACMLVAKDIYYLSDTIHYYRRRSKIGTLSVSWDRSLDYFKKINYAYKKIYDLFHNARKMGKFRYFYSKTLTSVFYKIVDTKIMNDVEKVEALKELRWFFNIRKKVNIEPCQKSLEYILRKIDEEKYEEAVECCKIVAELRTYIEKDVREGMSKPEFINYVEL